MVKHLGNFNNTPTPAWASPMFFLQEKFKQKVKLKIKNC
jgi:hypothetical protein